MRLPRSEADERCPSCGSGELLGRIHMQGWRVPHSGCLNCGALWETLPPGEPWMVDGELMPFASPCDNCAFRAGSPESENKPEWRDLLKRLRQGGSFYCHKGVAIEHETIPTADDQGMTLHSFLFPTDTLGEPDIEQMRMCRGFLNAWTRWHGVRRRA